MTRQVVQHTLLAHRGGAARVANMLHSHLPDCGWHSMRTAEVLDSAGGSCQQVPASALHGTGDAIFHLHSTAAWEEALSSLIGSPRVVLTLHDVGPLTGGCVYPLDCSGWLEGCPEPCPRGYPDAAMRQRQRRNLLSQAVQQLVAPSGWLARMARAALLGLGCQIIPNGVPAPLRSDARTARGMWAVRPEAFTVLFMAHGGEESLLKGGNRWLELWHTIKAEVPEALGFFVGGATAGRENDLVRLPYLDDAHLHSLRAMADVLVYPSLADNHPLCVLEACAAGVPVCSFSVGGIPEIIRHGDNGLLCPVQDWGGLAGACVTLARDRNMRRRMGHCAAEIAKAHFRAERMTGDYARCYETVRNRHGVCF